MRAVRLRRDKIVVALEHKVLMYNFADLRLEHSTETLANPHGLAALSPAPEHNVLACPGLHCGQARSLLETLDTPGYPRVSALGRAVAGARAQRAGCPGCTASRHAALTP